jgi:hypothetical protein
MRRLELSSQRRGVDGGTQFWWSRTGRGGGATVRGGEGVGCFGGGGARFIGSGEGTEVVVKGVEVR